MYIVEWAGRFCANPGLQRGNGLLNHGGVVNTMCCRERPLRADIGINCVNQADIVIVRWWVHGVDVLILAVGGMR